MKKGDGNNYSPLGFGVGVGRGQGRPLLSPEGTALCSAGPLSAAVQRHGQGRHRQREVKPSWLLAGW